MRTLIRLVRTLILLLVLALLAGAWWWLQDEALRPALAGQRGLEPEGCGPAPALPALRAAGRVRERRCWWCCTAHGATARRCAASAATASTGWRRKKVSWWPTRTASRATGTIAARPPAIRRGCVTSMTWLSSARWWRGWPRSTASICSGYMSPATPMAARWLSAWPPKHRVAGGDRNGGGEPADHGERCLSAGRAADRCVADQRHARSDQSLSRRQGQPVRLRRPGRGTLDPGLGTLVGRPERHRRAAGRGAADPSRPGLDRAPALAGRRPSAGGAAQRAWRRPRAGAAGLSLPADSRQERPGTGRASEIWRFFSQLPR